MYSMNCIISYRNSRCRGGWLVMGGCVFLYYLQDYKSCRDNLQTVRYLLEQGASYTADCISRTPITSPGWYSFDLFPVIVSSQQSSQDDILNEAGIMRAGGCGINM